MKFTKTRDGDEKVRWVDGGVDVASEPDFTVITIRFRDMRGAYWMLSMELAEAEELAASIQRLVARSSR